MVYQRILWWERSMRRHRTGTVHFRFSANFFSAIFSLLGGVDLIHHLPRTLLRGLRDARGARYVAHVEVY